jgi:hypothetical protein
MSPVRIGVAIAHALTWAMADHDDTTANRAQAALWLTALFALALILTL